MLSCLPMADWSFIAQLAASCWCLHSHHRVRLYALSGLLSHVLLPNEIMYYVFFSPKHLLYIKKSTFWKCILFLKKKFDNHVTEYLQREMVRLPWVYSKHLNKNIMALNNWGWVKGRMGASYWRSTILWAVGHILHAKKTYVVLRGRQVCLASSPLIAMIFITFKYF